MNKEDKIRFARYYPGYKITENDLDDDADLNDNLDNDTNSNDCKEEPGAPVKLGYIGNLTIDKESLVNSVINSSNTNKNTSKNTD